MSLMWRIYGEELVEERKNKLWQLFLGSKAVNRKNVWKVKIKEFFGDNSIECSDDKFYLNEISPVYLIEMRDTTLTIYFDKSFLPLFNRFIETMFPNEKIGISFSGCDVTKRNNKIVSIVIDGEEIFQNGLDQLKNQLFAL